MSDRTRRARAVQSTTGDAWRQLGFYQEIDDARYAWRLVGSREGLRQLPPLLRDFADRVAAGNRTSLELGPYGDFQLKYWERAGIDDDSIHGGPADFRRLADLVAERLEGATPGSELTIGPEYTSDLEYALLLAVMEDGYDPADAMLLATAEPDTPAIVADGIFTGTLPCDFHDPDAMFTETEGLVRIEGDHLVLEYQVKDAFFGAFRSGASEASIPFDAITDVHFKRGLFSATISVQARDMKSVADVPTAKRGRIRLKFKRLHRDDAQLLAESLQALTGG